jgi:anti-sigma regulatory factor (Ser/Thr protein kinase)
MESNAWEIRLVVPSRIESLSVMNAVAEEVAQQLDFDEEAQNAITISVIEAGTNAIHHGNQEDAAVPTEVLFRRENGALVILIRDQGKGFDLAKVKDPLDRQNFSRKAGVVCSSFDHSWMKSIFDSTGERSAVW